MITREWTEAETLAVMHGLNGETERNWLEYSENFFAHGLQDERRNSEEMQRILGKLEGSAKIGNEVAGAVLGFAVLNTFKRVQVVEDGLSFLSRAMRKHIPGAAAELCAWYAERLIEDDWDGFEDVDLGLEDCYHPTEEFPRVALPNDARDCTARVFEAAACAIEDFGMADVSLTLATVINTFNDIEPNEIASLEQAILKKAKARAEESMMTYAVMRMADCGGDESCATAVRILEAGAEQGLPYALGFLGEILMAGLDGLLPEDAAKGFDYSQRAAAAGDAHAKYTLSRCYRNGWATAADADKANALLEEAVAGRVPGALVEYGRMLIDAADGAEKGKAIKRGCEMIRAAAEEMDFPPAWEAMLEYHEKGLGPFKTNKFRRAAKAALARFQK